MDCVVFQEDECKLCGVKFDSSDTAKFHSKKHSELSRRGVIGSGIYQAQPWCLCACGPETEGAFETVANDPVGVRRHCA